MMPLSATDLLGPAGTLASALLIGFAFGWLLERAGLACAPRLAGQFYFADLTVLKVLATALVTAMLGAFSLDWLGVLELDLVYMPETFVAPQAIGGLIFGAGFLVGGLCPGTSCVAAATGRVDGLGVIGGMLLGVLAFNVSFDRIAPFYNSTAMGPVTIAEAVRTWRGRMPSVRFISAPALAERIMQRDERFRLFDLRAPSAFERFHIPGALSATTRSLRHYPLETNATAVVYADRSDVARRAWTVLHGRKVESFVMRGGLEEWLLRVHAPRLAADATPAERAEFDWAARLSRFFGGTPQVDVPRDQLLAAATIPRRGC